MIITKEKLDPKIPIRVYAEQCKQGAYDFDVTHTFDSGFYTSLSGTIHYKCGEELDYCVESIEFHDVYFYRKDNTRLDVDSDLLVALINALDVSFVV